jgi:hypothetical protein
VRVLPMTDKPIVLDEHRGMAARTATEIRRASHAVEADQAALRRRQAELETFLVAAPAAGWPEAAEKARYLLKLFAATCPCAKLHLALWEGKHESHDVRIVFLSSSTTASASEAIRPCG